MMFLGALIGCASSAIVFMIATKMNRRTATLDEIKVLLNKASLLGLESSKPALGSTIPNIVGRSNVEHVKQEYLDTVNKIHVECEKTIERKFTKLLEDKRKYLHYDTLNNAPEKERVATLSSASSTYRDAVRKIEDYFEKFEKKKKKKKNGILPLQEIADLTYLNRFANPATRWWIEESYILQDKDIRSHLDAIEKIEEEYKSLQEKYDSGYLVDIITRINRVQKIKDKFLNQQEPVENDKKYVFNALNKIQGMGDMGSLTEKEFKDEISLLKEIGRDYRSNNSVDRENYEILAKHLAEWLVREDWGRNPREEIHEARSLWREIVVESFPQYKYY